MIIWLRNLLIPMEAVRVYLCFKGVHSKNSLTGLHAHLYALSDQTVFFLYLILLHTQQKKKKRPSL